MNWALLGSIILGVLVPLSIYLHRMGKLDLQVKHKELKLQQEKIYTQVCAINGRVVKLETFADMHEEADNRRFTAINEDLTELKRRGPPYPSPRRKP